MAIDTGAGERKTNVFISYSRRDAEAADRLHEALTAQGLNPYLDKHDIAAGEDWKARLGGLIESADTMVFLISPDSIASSVCDWEVNHAELKGKRILPVVIREPGEGVPERLQRLNYVFMRNPDEETGALPRLADALAVDIAWIRNHTRYGDDAGEWETAGRPSRLLLRGASIGEAERWRDSRPPTAPQLTETQSAYIAASRRGATNRARGWTAGSIVVALIAIGLSVYAFIQQQAAEASRIVAEASQQRAEESQAAAEASEQRAVTVLATSDLRQGTDLSGDAETAADGMAYLARAAEAGDDRAQTRLWTMLQQRSFWLPAATASAVEPAEPPPAVPQDILDRFAQVDVNGELQTPQNIAISGDGRRVFTAVGDVPNQITPMVKVWNADGTPVTDWWEPPYSGDFYLYRISGTFNHDGRYLAVELEGWRETSTLVAYDLETMAQLETDITASGLLPQTQSIGFNSVRFVERPATSDREAETYLVTAAAKGDAVVYALFGTRLEEVARNRHRAAVRVADIDPDDQWLMSAGWDRSVSISTLHTFNAIGNLVFADSVPTALRRSGPAGLMVQGETGGWASYNLKAPVKRKPMPVAPLDTEGGRQEACLRITDPYGEGQTRFEHPSGLLLTAEPNRQVGAARAGEPAKLSPAFTADLYVVCASDDGSLVTVTTADFRTEIWTADFSARLGPAINERAYFGDGSTPEKTDWAAISPDGKRVMIRSSFWNPPNLELFWISLWDIETGLPLMDRTAFADDGLTDGVVRSARFAGDGHLTFIGDTALTPATLELTTPAVLPAALPDYAEAIAGQSINAQGLAELVPNRAGALEAGNRLLESLAE
ncbi:MAG: toll/interleukin-1 receptor domain-containing protein [Hyphomicrobiales bacterium]|nr:MAG: toll/interleukin-1 receptor domain-containing protein [Hyphomicrobiales bacterium]